MKRPIEEMWLSFREHIVPDDASIAQINGMKLCFYSGAHGCFETMMISGNGNTEEAFGIFNEINRDIQTFIADIDSEVPDGDQDTKH